MLYIIIIHYKISISVPTYLFSFLFLLFRIDKFLEGYTSDGAERQENNYYIDTFDDDHLKIFDTANVVNTNLNLYICY